LSPDDSRLKELKEVSQWFDEWSLGVSEEKEKNSMLLSSQCQEDLRSCLIGFCDLCETVLSKKGTSIVPALINSDVIENHFCQQRATYNGANTNPTALQYRRTLNSVILGQNIVSQKSNSGKSSIKSPKLSFVPSTRGKRAHSDTSDNVNYTQLKVIKM